MTDAPTALATEVEAMKQPMIMATLNLVVLDSLISHLLPFDLRKALVCYTISTKQN